MTKFRKPMQRQQGLKILGYGEDGSGKSWTALTFPKLAIVDTESKLGVYENNPEKNQNILGIADTVNYYDVIELMEEVVGNPKTYSTFVIDSETNLYDSMQVSMMEVEENRAKKKKKSVDDATVSKRGWGKVKLNNSRLKNLKAQMSANGVTIISIAHKKDIFQEIDGKQIKIGEMPELKKGSKHDYDVVLRFFKKKDIATGEYRFYAEVEKDTTLTYKIGTQLENVSYNNWEEYIERNKKGKVIESSYDNAIEKTISATEEEEQGFEELSNEFVKLFKELKDKDDKNKELVTNLLKLNNVDSYKDSNCYDGLKVVVEKMREM